MIDYKKYLTPADIIPIERVLISASIRHKKKVEELRNQYIKSKEVFEEYKKTATK